MKGKLQDNTQNTLVQPTKKCDSATSLERKNGASFSVVLHFVTIPVFYCGSFHCRSHSHLPISRTPARVSATIQRTIQKICCFGYDGNCARQ